MVKMIDYLNDIRFNSIQYLGQIYATSTNYQKNTMNKKMRSMYRAHFFSLVVVLISI